MNNCLNFSYLAKNIKTYQIKMKKLTLDFEGQEVRIPLPSSLSNLRDEISNKFLFNPSDTAELKLSYISHLKTKYIQNEEDFTSFLKLKVSKIKIELNENSKLYVENLAKITQETLENRKKLSELKLKINTNRKNQKIELNSNKQLISELEKTKKKLMQEKLALVKFTQNEMKNPKKLEHSLEKQIIDLEKKLNLPLVLTFPTKVDFPINKETVDGKKLYELIIKNTKCVKEQEINFMPKMSLGVDFDKKIKEVNKIIRFNIKESQKLIEKLKKEELELMKQIINLEKKLGIKVTEKIPYKKPGFYFPKRAETKNELILSSEVKNSKEEKIIEEKNIEEKKDEERNEKEVKTEEKNEKNVNIKVEKNEKQVKIIKGRKNDKNEIKENNIVHKAVKCNGCKMNPIIGIRYKCTVCDDFDYCEKCEEKYGEKHNHPFLKIRNPRMNPIFIKCEVRKDDKIK